eukprot:12165898-Heterocapsa_arctica.AAC.1
MSSAPCMSSGESLIDYLWLREMVSKMSSLGVLASLVSKGRRISRRASPSPCTPRPIGRCFVFERLASAEGSAGFDGSCSAP